MSEANRTQVGGAHYKTDGEQHWDRQWRMFGAGYFIGCITKYVERYQKKNGLEDLRKARHFLDKLIELEMAEGDDGPTKAYVDQDREGRFRPPVSLDATTPFPPLEDRR